VVNGYIDGVPVIITDAITKQVRKRTHRKKRIDKKWQKKYGYKSVTDHSKIIVYDDGFYKHFLMSQKCYDRMTEALAKMGE